MTTYTRKCLYARIVVHVHLVFLSTKYSDELFALVIVIAADLKLL